jgi:hypothetical protein
MKVDTTNTDPAYWEAILEKEGLGMGAGHDANIIKYGSSQTALVNAEEEARDKGLTPEVHMVAVREHIRQLNVKRHESRTAYRAKMREEKKALREKVWKSNT